MDRRRAAGALLALAACIACSAAAPTAGNHSALDLYDGAVVEGCYYNFQHYSEGDRIMTNEPCLNCTCHNRMLMCYLRVCPFTKPIGQNCTVEKRADQCCPIVTCPDVPVDLLTSTSTSSPAEYGATGVGKFDKYGCSIDGKYLPEGAKVPPTPNKPCEHCYCIRNMTTCVMQECTLHVDGCTPIYHKDVCCPVRYSCDHPEDEIPLLDDMTTTVRPTPGFILTTPTISPVTQITQDCVHDDQVFADGALIKTEKACEHCYCMKGDIVCVVQECGTPMENEGKNCTSLPPREGQCCPDTYICEGDESTTDYNSQITTNLPLEELTTLTPPRRVGVEGSGYRNEPDEIPITELPSPVSEAEGSGEENTMAPTDVTSETFVDGDQKHHIPEKSMTTVESILLATQKTTSESEIQQSTVKSDEGTEQPDITNYERSTIESITQENHENVPHEMGDTVQEESVITSTDSSKQFTEIQKEIETTEPFIEPSKTTSSFDYEQKTISPTQIGSQEIITPGSNKNKYEEGLSTTTSSSIYQEVENVTPEKSVVEITTLDSKTSSESEIYGSTSGDSHTLTLEEVEKDESEMDKHTIDTEKLIEEFTTESHDYTSSSDTNLLQEAEPHKTHDGADEGFDKEITDTHEFIPVTTSISTIGITTETYKEDSITEKEPDQDIYETPHHITTSTPHIKIESSTQTKNEEVSEEAEKYVTPGSQEIVPSTTSELAEISKPDADMSLDKLTTSDEHITSIADIADSSSEITQKTPVPEIISSDHKITTIMPTLDSKGDVTTMVTESKTYPTTISEIESSAAHLTTAVPEFDKETYTFTPVTGEEITIKYDTSSELPPPEVIVDSTTEPDKGLNTIPAGGIDEDQATSLPVVSASESYTTKNVELAATTESGIIKDDVESKKTDKSSTELSVEKELSTTQVHRLGTTELPEEKETIPAIITSEDYGHIITDQVSQTTTEFLSLTTVPQFEFEKESSTDLTIEKTDMPITSTIDQGENEIHEDILVPGRIPGEGDCLLNGVTYRNESNVPSTHNCHAGCKCISSIIKCDPIICSSPPDYMDNCQPTYDPPDACCPTYECTHVSKETMPPQPQSQMSGTEAPLKPPSFECRGDQCEISEDKLQPTASHETCAGAECKADIDKKTEPSDCGPHGCDIVEEIPVSQEVESEHTQICTDGKCTTQTESCTNGECHPTELRPAQQCVGDNCVVQSETLPTPVPEKCYIEGNCKDTPLSLPCEGDKCTSTDQIYETGDKVICKEEGGCLEPTNECEGESCRRKEIASTEVKVPTTCTDAKCLKQPDTTTEHKAYEGTASVPILTETEEQISGTTVASAEDRTTDSSQNAVHGISIHSDITETPEIITRLPEISTDKIIAQTSVKLESSSESPTKDQTESSEIVKDHVTEKSTDIIEDSSKAIEPEKYVTEKQEDLTSVTKETETDIEEHDKETKIPESIDVQNTVSTYDIHGYTTEVYTKEVILQSTQSSTDIDKTTKPFDIEKGTTVASGTGLESETASYGVSLEEQDSSELPYEQGTDFKPDLTESNKIDITLPQQFTTEHSYGTVDEGLQEIVTLPQHLPESPKGESTEIEKQVTESVLHVDTLFTTIESEMADRTTVPPDQELSETERPKVSYKPVDSEQKTTETLLAETTTKSEDSVVLTGTIPEEDHVEYEKTTTKTEIYSTVLDKETVTTYRPDKENKIEFPVPSDIDKEEYITDEPSISEINEETLATTPKQSYDLQSQTATPEENEAISQEELQVTVSEIPIKITEADHEIEKDILTTESPKISEPQEILTEPTQSSDEHEEKVPEILEETDHQKYTTTAPSTVENKYNEISHSIEDGFITENSLPLTTEKIYTETSEKETRKPVAEYITTQIPVSISETSEDTEKVTMHKDISLEENIVTELPEQFIPTEPEKSVTKVITDDEKHKITTLEDKTLQLDHETSTRATESDFDSHTKIPTQEDLVIHETEGSKVSEPTSTLTSIIEHLTVTFEDTTTEVPLKDTKLPESEPHLTTPSSIVKESETESSPLLELETKATSTPSDTGKEQKTTNIPVTTKFEHGIDSEPQADLTTESFVTETSGSTVSETEYKHNEIPTYTATTVQKPVTEYAKVTEKHEFVKETDIKPTSFTEDGKITTNVVLPDVIPTSNEQSTTISEYDYGVKEIDATESESKANVSTESSYPQQTQLPESLSHKHEDILSPEIHSTISEEIQTVSPIVMITEVPKVVTITTEEDITVHKETPIEPNDKQEISTMYTQQTTERVVKLTEKISEFGEENTTPLVSVEYTSSPKYEYSDSTSDLVELEELTHKFLEESLTTPGAPSSEEGISHAESTEKVVEEAVTSITPISEEKTSVSEEKILEETGKTTHDSFGQEISHDVSTEKISIDATASKRPNIEEEISDNDKTREDIPTTSRLGLEEIGYSEATDKILEETTTSESSVIEEDKDYTVTTYKTLEDIETTDRVSAGSIEKETDHFEVTDKFLEKERVTTQRPTVDEEISPVHDSEKVSEEIATPLSPDVLKEPDHSVTTEKILEETFTTLSSGLDKETSHSVTTERALEGTVTTSHSEKEIYHQTSTDRISEYIDTTTSHFSSEVETSQSENTEKIIDQIETTSYPGLEKETAHSYTTEKISKETEITPLTTLEEVSHSETTDKTLEHTAITQHPGVEGEISDTEGTDKFSEDAATSSHPDILKETNAESTPEGSIESVTSLPFSPSEETTIYSENADKDFEQTVTTQRFKGETGHDVFTENILDENVPTIRPSSEEKDIVATEKLLQEAVTSIRPSYEEEVGQDKISEESFTTPELSSEMQTGHTIPTDKTEESVTPLIPSLEEDLSHTTEKILEQSASTPHPSSQKESGHFIDTEKTLVETVTSQTPGFVEEISHVEGTDKILEEIATTLQPSIEKEPDHSIDTEKILEESSTSQSPSLVEDISHAVTTEKILDEVAPTLHSISEDGTIYAKTTLTPEVITAQTSFEHETSYADVTEKILEDSVTTQRISLEDEKTQVDSQKLEPQPEFVTEKVIDEQSEKDIDTSTKTEEESKTPTKEPTVAGLPTETLTPDIPSQPAVHAEQTSSPSTVSQETESQEKVISTETPPKHIEGDKSHLDSKEKVPQLPSQEMPIPEEEVVSLTTKGTTMSIEEYVTTHAPAPVDKFTKPEEKPIEDTQATLAPELPKPSGIQPTDEVQSPEEESHFPPSGTSGYGGETDYGDEDQAFGPGTCRYGGKVYVSAQQIPRDDPCDFCFCFRSDIICLQQSCPPPIHGCHEEPIQGFCCPRYECPVSMATTLNVTTTTTTTTTTLPPHFPTHSYKGAAHRRGCQIKGHTYKVGEVVRASSGPCLHCTCGGDGQMKCDPKACTPEPMLRQMIAAAVSAKRRR